MEEINGSLPEILATGGVATGGIGAIVWWLIKRLIARIDKLENVITGTGGISEKLAVNIANDEAFVKRFEDHLRTHEGIEEVVEKRLDKFESDMDLKYKRK